MKKPSKKKKSLRSRMHARARRRKDQRRGAMSQFHRQRKVHHGDDFRHGRKEGEVGEFSPIDGPSREEREKALSDWKKAVTSRKTVRSDQRKERSEKRKKLSARITEWMASVAKKRRGNADKG